MKQQNRNKRRPPQRVRKFVRRLTAIVVAVSLVCAAALYAIEVVHII